jgi:hypothetical protein
MEQRHTKRFETRCNEPLAQVCLEEAHSMGLALKEVWEKSGLSWATMLNFKRAKHPHGVSLNTMKRLARGINARVVILTDDGRIIEPPND